MKTCSVDFQAIKDRARFETVLAHYGVILHGAGAEQSAMCPFHRETRPSFRANLKRSVFYCFGCEAKGDILDFVARMEAVSVKQAALIVASLCGIPTAEDGVGRRSAKGVHQEKRRASDAGAQCEVKGTNKPLPFTLTLDPDHPYFRERQVPRDVIEAFGLGYCRHGVMRGRICIPIHDGNGQLVAYAGRWASDDVPDGVTRYRLPRGFRKSEVVFNLFRVAPHEHIVIVEGYWSVFRLHSLRVPAAALMGRTLSQTQERLLRGSNVRLMTLLLDGDEPGRSATAELLPRLSHSFFVRTLYLPDGSAPDTLEEATLREVCSR